MINATTHAGAEHARNETSIPILRFGSRSFAALLGLELVLFVSLLAWALFTLLPTATPLAATAELVPVQAAIRARINGSVDDPLVTVSAATSARASNLRGFSLNGATYYYYVEGAENYDPFSRGAVARDAIEILLHDSDGPHSFVVYRIL